MSEPSDRHAASSLHRDRELEVSVRTVRLEELLAILRRHTRLVVGVVLATVAAAGLVAYLMGPTYSAVAVIRLSDPRRALTGGVILDPASADERFSDPLLSQAQLLTSRGVAGAVVDSMPVLRVLPTRGLPLRLLGDVAVPAAAGPDSFQLSFGPDSFVVRGSFGRRVAAYGTVVDAGGLQFTVLHRTEASQGRLRLLGREAAITRLLKDLRVRPRLRTDIVDVTYSAPDPHFAQQVVNHVVDIFRSASAEAAQAGSRRRREFLEGQLKVNDSLLADARQAVTAFRQRAGAYGSREALAREQAGLAGVELQRQQLEAERRTDESLLAALRDRDSSVSRKALQTALATPGVAASPSVTQLSTQLYQYERARDSLASRSTSHPDLPRLNHLIGSTEADLLHAVQGGIQSAIASLEGRITAMNDLRARQQHLSTTEPEEARLTERVDNAQKIADELRVEFQKAGIAEAITVGQVEIVDHAALPAKPAGIGLPEQIALGLLVGLMLGSAGAFLADRLGGTIAQRGQVEQLGMSVIGVITHLDRNAKGNGATSPDAVVEAFRGLRLSLVNEYDPASGPIVVTVTSPGSGDGKSFVSSNLALAFSYAKQRTLLVDADLRRGALHRVLNLRRQPGLTDFLAGDVARAPVLQKTSHPCLDFIASGTRRRDAPELLGSAAMADLVTSLRSTYDVIVLDTAPLGAGVDALALAKLAGNLLMVLRLGRTDRELAEAKLEILRRLPLRLLGAVLNDVRDESEYRAYAYYMDGYGLTNEPLFRPLAGGKQDARSHAGR